MDDADPQQISEELLFGLVNVLVPNQPGHVVRPVGPDGEVWLNPQPLPPHTSLTQDPWRAVAVTRTIVSAAALAVTTATDRELGIRAGRSTLDAFVDEFVGTQDRAPLPLPPPWPRLDVRPNALDLVVAAAQLHSASTVMGDYALSADLAASARRLLSAALERLAR